VTKRITTAILTIICIFILVPTIAFAADLGSSNLTVIMDYGNTPISEIDISICQVANAAQDANGNVNFTAVPAFSGMESDFTNLSTEDKNVALAASLNAFASANNIVRSDKPTDSDGKASFTGLSAGIYLVAQKSGTSSEYKIDPYLVMVPQANTLTKGGWNYNVISYPKVASTKVTVNTTSVSVYKVWQGTTNHPANVSVQLYRNGNPYGDAIMLNNGNYWSCTWNDLNPNATWTVDELNVPDSYIKTISGNVSNGFVITNTKTTIIPPQRPPMVGGNAPKTGDDSNMPLWIFSIITGFIGLSIVICVLNSKRLSRIFTRK